MTTADQIKAYLDSLPEQKKSDMLDLHKRILQLAPKEKLWFDTGKDANNKTVSNPAIGYGKQTLLYADGKQKDFFRIGISANTSGVTVYFMGIKDRQWLARNFAAGIGKAQVTSYCIKFKKLADIQLQVLEAAIREAFGLPAT